MKTSEDVVWEGEKGKSFAKTTATSEGTSLGAAVGRIMVRVVKAILVGFAMLWLCRLIGPEINSQRVSPFVVLLAVVFWIVFPVVFIRTVSDCIDNGRNANLRPLIVTLGGLPAVGAVILLFAAIDIAITPDLAAAAHVHWVFGTFEFWIVAIPTLVAAVAITISYITRRPGAMGKFLVVMLHPLYDPDRDGSPFRC